jgi:mannose-1-phosphate guanylyltransferase
MNAVILCAGEGVRMKPVTDHLPKPLLPVIGKPLIDRTMDSLFAQGIERIGVNIHHKADQLHEHLEAYPRSITISHEPVLLGTGGALRFFEYFVSDSFLVHSGDIMTNADIRSIIAFHERHEPMVTLALVKSEHTDYICIDEEQNVVDIATTIQPDKSDYYTFSGISVFSNQVFSLLPARDVFSMVEVFHAVQHTGGLIKGYPCTTMAWYNINSCRALWSMHRDIFNQTVTFDGIEVTSARFIDHSSTVKTTDVEGFVSIGAHCVVGEGVRLGNTVVFDDTNLVEGTYTDCLVSDVFCVRI